MGAGNLLWARAFLRHRTTSIPWQIRSGLWLLSLLTSGRFVPVALEAQGLEVLGLCGEGLVHGDDVVQLARRRGDGRRAELAPVILLREHGLPRPGRIPARLEEVKEDLARRARQALPAIGEPQPAHPGLQHLQVLVEGADDAVLAAAHSQAQAPPLAHAPHDHLGAVPLGQELPPDLLQVLGVEVAAADLALPIPSVLELRRFACLPLAPVFGLGPVPDRLAPRDGAGGFVEEGVAVPAREGHGPLLLDRRLELVQQAGGPGSPRRTSGLGARRRRIGSVGA